MHVCMHEWFHVEMCIFMFSFIYVCISGYRFLFSMVCMCKNACIHICIFCIVHSVHTSNIYDIDTCIHIYTHVCNRYMYVLNICMHVYVCIYIFFSICFYSCFSMYPLHTICLAITFQSVCFLVRFNKMALAIIRRLYSTLESKL